MHLSQTPTHTLYGLLFPALFRSWRWKLACIIACYPWFLVFIHKCEMKNNRFARIGTHLSIGFIFIIRSWFILVYHTLVSRIRKVGRVVAPKYLHAYMSERFCRITSTQRQRNQIFPWLAILRRYEFHCCVSYYIAAERREVGRVAFASNSSSNYVWINDCGARRDSQRSKVCFCPSRESSLYCIIWDKIWWSESTSSAE